jgi:hypothetical protein
MSENHEILRSGGHRRLKKASLSRPKNLSPTDPVQAPYHPPNSPYPHSPPDYDSIPHVIYAVSPSTASSNSTSSHSSTTPSTTTSQSPPTLTPPRVPENSQYPLNHAESTLSSEHATPSHSISAPELHKKPQKPTQPPRRHTIPTKDSRTPKRKQAMALDKIDELDESDPFHHGWHHDGPYEAARPHILNAVPPLRVCNFLFHCLSEANDPTHSRTLILLLQIRSNSSRRDKLSHLIMLSMYHRNPRISINPNLALKVTIFSFFPSPTNQYTTPPYNLSTVKATSTLIHTHLLITIQYIHMTQRC